MDEVSDGERTLTLVVPAGWAGGDDEVGEAVSG
jgi:hypothetical protein